MAVSQDDIDTLLTAMASGAKEVRYPDGSRVVYQDVTQMERALALLRQQLAAQSTTDLGSSRFAEYCRD